MSKKQTRITTKQPGVYLNQQTEKYDIKYSYTEYDPISDQKKHRSKWICGIPTYREAVKRLADMKNGRNTGERSYDIFSRLLDDRIIMLSEEVNDTTASLIVI